MLLNIDGVTIDVERQLLELDRADYEDSLYLFLKAGWSAIDPSPWVDGWPIEAVAEHLQAVVDGEIRRLIINIPPRCSKSSLCSVALPAWCWAQSRDGPMSGPGVRFLHASYNYSLSIRDSRACRQLIQSNWYQRHWGDRFKLRADNNAKVRFSNDHNGERLITSVGPGGTGEGGSCFVAGTLVSTPSGHTPIEEIQIGSMVYAFDHEREKVVESRVIATAERASRDLYKFRSASGHQFTCTGDHPVFSPGRGYIRACDMGPRDRILVSGIWPVPADNDDSPDLRHVRQPNRQTLVGDAQGAQGGECGRILQQEVLLGPSCREEPQAMRGLRSTEGETTRPILFGGVQDIGANGAEKEMAVSEMWSSVWHEGSYEDEILLLNLCGCGPFGSDARSEELELHGVRKILEPLSDDAPDCGRARREPMRIVWRGGSDSSAWNRSEIGTTCSPYQREHEEQRARKSDYPVRELPQEASQWELATVSSVEFIGGREVSVYDIQVEGRSNFFANGVLVHNCIIVDDPNAAGEVTSEATVETTIDWWDGTMSSRHNDQKTGAYIVVQQRLGEDDLTGHILSKSVGEWTHLCLPMRYEPERSYTTIIGWKDPRTEAGELLWPARFDEAAVSGLERSMGPFRAAGQLQQRPEPAGGGVIKREWWKLWDEPAFPPMDYIIASLDTAYTEKTANDFSALTVWGVYTASTQAVSTRAIGRDGRPTYNERAYAEASPRVMLMDAWQERLELHDLVTKVAETAKKLKIDKLLIESKASGHSVAQEVRRLYGHEGFAVQLCDPKSQDKLSRLYSVQHLFAEGMVHAPDRKWADMVMTQVGQFPHGKHDDIVDTVSQALRHLRDIGLLIRGPERLADIESSKQYTGRPLAPLYPA